MPTSIIRTEREERLWSKAKEIAKKSGKRDNYKYIMGVYKKMLPGRFNKEASVGLPMSTLLQSPEMYEEYKKAIARGFSETMGLLQKEAAYDLRKGESWGEYVARKNKELAHLDPSVRRDILKNDYVKYKGTQQAATKAPVANSGNRSISTGAVDASTGQKVIPKDQAGFMGRNVTSGPGGVHVGTPQTPTVKAPVATPTAAAGASVVRQPGVPRTVPVSQGVKPVVKPGVIGKAFNKFIGIAKMAR